VREVPTRERGIIKSVELPGYEPYFLLMKSTSLKKHKRTQSTRFIKEKVFYVSLKLFSRYSWNIKLAVSISVPGILFDT
jgi:hypothetical protein